MRTRRVPAAGRGLPKKRTALKPIFIPKPAWMPPSEGEVLLGTRERRVAPRQIVEAAIERLIGLLDHLDPDPDLEPSIGGGSFGAELDAEGDPSDDEPSLGSLGHIDQTTWGLGTTDDREVTGLAEDDETLGWAAGRSWSETQALRVVEAEALALARRVHLKKARGGRPGAATPCDVGAEAEVLR